MASRIEALSWADQGRLLPAEVMPLEMWEPYPAEASAMVKADL